MRDNALGVLSRIKTVWSSFTSGQRMVAIIGTAAVLIAAFMVFKWSAKPQYQPLYSGVSSEDASAIVDKLKADGIPYQLSDGGATIMVPAQQVYETRIAMSGEGLPNSSAGGYSILDDQGLSTSEFQQQTDFKRAMEGELSKTIEAIDGINTAVVHLALPQKKVFTDTQDPTTASVLVATAPGVDLGPDQVQAIVNLVSSSVEGLDEKNVSVTDAKGQVLKAPGDSEAASAAGQDQQVIDFQNRLSDQVQTTMDRVVGPGNSTVTVTPVLNFDKTSEQTTRYFGNPVTLSEATSNEQLDGSGTSDANRGILGPQSQMETDLTNGTNGTGQYAKDDQTRDFGNNVTVSNTEAAPGQVESLHVGVMVDQASLQGRSTTDIQNSLASALGIDPARGDTISVTPIAFDRTAEQAAAAELAAAANAEKQDRTFNLIRNGAIAGILLLALLLAWLQSRRKNRQRMQAAALLAEQIRNRAIAQTQANELELITPEPTAIEAPAAVLALETAEDEMDAVRREIADIIDSGPDEAADLLRGWLTTH